MVKSYCVALALVGAVVSPAEASNYFIVTTSGSTEVLLVEPPAEVAGKLAAKCIDVRWQVTTATSNEVVCETP